MREIYIYVYMCIYIYIHIYKIEQNEKEKKKPPSSNVSDLRIFLSVSVSNPGDSASDVVL
jgi:hypothetical protein